jgi:hypothetical protein
LDIVELRIAKAPITHRIIKKLSLDLDSAAESPLRGAFGISIALDDGE